MGARYYDPQVGRFISRDVVLSEHPYLYCEHEPVNAVDPSGRISILVGLLIAVVAVVVLPGCGNQHPAYDPWPGPGEPIKPGPGGNAFNPGDTDSDTCPDNQDRYPRDPHRW